MDKYIAIERYESKIAELEAKRELILSTLADRDVTKRSNGVLKNAADIDMEIAIYVDFIETISALKIE